MPRLLVGLPLPVCAVMLALAPVDAHAIDPAHKACAELKAGVSCSYAVPSTDGGKLSYRVVDGQCQSDKCCDQDYSQGSPPKVDCHECLTCVPAEPEAGASSQRAAASSPRASSPRVGEDPPAQARGCNVTPGAAGLWWLLLLPLLRRST